MRYRRNFAPVITPGKSGDEYAGDNKTRCVRITDGTVKAHTSDAHSQQIGERYLIHFFLNEAL
jgi:hypothetical protein